MENPKYLLDVGTLLALVNGQGKAVRHRLNNINSKKIGAESTAIFDVVLQCDRDGQFSDLDRSTLQEFLEEIQSLESSIEDSKLAIRLRNELRRSGFRFDKSELILAAIAMRMEATIVTTKLEKFGKINGLQLTNWCS